MVIRFARRHRPLAAAAALAALALARSPAAGAAGSTDGSRWLGDDLPLPLAVKTPQDIWFKTAVERQYLIFNLMASGKLAWQRGDFAGAADRWDTLLRLPSLDPQIERAVAPFLREARARAAGAPASRAFAGEAPPEPAGNVREPPPPAAVPRRVVASAPSVSGTVAGGGQIGPGGTVLWLRRLDGPMPRIVPPPSRVITQREKTFLPHVLAVPVGTTVQFRNDDRIYHNVFSLAKPNDFDAGIRASGATYTRTFNHTGAVEILCNIHTTMQAYVYVVDSPWYAKAQASGAFVIRNVVPGRYELSAWHESSSTVAHRTLVVGPDGVRDVAITVGSDKHPEPFVPDKYGHMRQPQLGY